MIDPRQIAFDIDGVIANTMQLFVDIAQEVYGINHINYQDITNYHLEHCLDMPPEIIGEITARIIDGDYPCDLAPIDDAGRVLRRVGDYGPIHLITARPKPGPMASWITALLPPERYRIVMDTTGDFQAKVDVLKAYDIRFFVEDRLDTCFLVNDNGITPVLFIQPWNRSPHPFIEVDGWRRLEQLLDFD